MLVVGPQVFPFSDCGEGVCSGSESESVGSGAQYMDRFMDAGTSVNMGV